MGLWAPGPGPTSGNDTFTGDAGADLAAGGLGDDLLNGGGGNDALTGDAGDDRLVGEDGDDILDGVNGNDTLTGGNGDDVLIGGDGNDTLDGMAGVNHLFGGAGDDFLRVAGGGHGEETFDGGLGLDTLVVSYGDFGLPGGNIPYDLTGNLMGIEALGFSGIEDAAVEADWSAFGILPADLIIRGGGGGGQMRRDRITITLSTPSAVDLSGWRFDSWTAGEDRIEICGSAGMDQLTGSRAADHIFGGDGDDVISADAGDDTISGGQGGDTIDGGAGFDTYDATGDAAVFVQLVWGWARDGFGSEDHVTSVENILGSNDADVLIGWTGANTFSAGAGNDWIEDVGDGNDVFRGDSGDDVIFGGAGDDTLTGNDGNDALQGAEGNDNLDGGAGNDWIYAGQGADTVIGGDGDDVLFGGEGGGPGAASDGADAISAGSGNDLLVGEGGDDVLDTGGGDDWAYGGIGNDIIIGGAGSDVLHGEDGDDTLAGGNGNDLLYGAFGDDVVDGGAGNDWLEGSFGNDVIIGGLGADSLFGGGGDRFVYTSVVELTEAAADRIGAFWREGGDKIDVSAIDADGNSANGATEFTFVSDFTGVAGQAVISYDGTDSVARFDTNGDGISDMTIVVLGVQLEARDFILSGPRPEIGTPDFVEQPVDRHALAHRFFIEPIDHNPRTFDPWHPPLPADDPAPPVAAPATAENQSGLTILGLIEMATFSL